MDIVDIDKVLDDLELDEDQQTKDVHCLRSNSYEVPSSTSITTITTNSCNNDANTVIPSNTSTRNNHLNESYQPIRTTKSNYVNVSNVFLSLNEYVSANVNTIDAIDQSHILNTNENDMTSVYNEYPFITTAGDVENVKHTQNNDENILKMNEMEKNAEKCENNDCQSIDMSMSSTSSILPSTLSTNNDFSIIQPTTNSTISNAVFVSSLNESEKNDTENVYGNNDAIDKDNQILTKEASSVLDKKKKSLMKDLVDSDQFKSTLTHLNELDQFNEQKVEGSSSFNEIEVVDNDEDNEGEFDETEDDEVGEESDNIRTNDALEDPDLPQFSSIMISADNNNVPSVAPLKEKLDDKFIKPSTFEAVATMDDVSDAELESYLQELEDLENSVQQENTNTNENDEKHIKNIDCEMADNDAQDEIISGAIRNEQIQTIDTVNEIIEKDDRNADSFSQASTVEFADIPTNNELRMPIYTNNVSKEPDQGSDGILNDNVSEEHEISINQINIESKTENDENSSLRDNTNELDSATASCSAAIKRPNTLPIVPNTVDSNSEQAGSTPAAIDNESSTDTHLSDEAITSCSSSDESNIILTNGSNQFEDTAPSLGESDLETSSASGTGHPHAERQNVPSAGRIGMENIGKLQPYWIPDNMTMHCMQCNQKFSFLKRRHHCRACGQVLCALCASMKAKLEYMGDVEARICIQCDICLNQRSNNQLEGNNTNYAAITSAIDANTTIDTNSTFGTSGNKSTSTRSPNPNNPMEYCSMIPPHQQVSASTSTAPISVMVPVGVLKREGSASKSTRKEKNVMFSDGIRPGCDLTELDESWNVRTNNDSNGNVRKSQNNFRAQTPPGESSTDAKLTKKLKDNSLNLPPIDPKTNSYIPVQGKTKDSTNIDNLLPPICLSTRTEFKYMDVVNNEQLIERLTNEEIKFIIQRNFYVLVKIIKLTCCINKTVINFTTHGMHTVGQDEIIILLEMDSSNCLPKDIFLNLNDIYRDADKGVTISELGFSIANQTPFLGSKEHGGFLFIRPTFQCMQNIIVPENQYLIGILIHRWEVPWAKILPLRLMLRLGALHRYYPSPHVSVRGRNSVYAEIAQTIINFLADFRTYSFTIATIRGMYIHMEDRRTSVLIPRNRYDQIMKALNNSSDHILALAGNFSKVADGHLVCVQNTESGCAETHAYSTQAINIQGKPRKVTGATFFVLNGALKTTSGLSGKCSIVEDGLMVQILSKKMVAIQQALKNMKNIDIVCGPVDADESQTETVSIQWVDNDIDINIGVVSPIDKKPMDGILSIRVHRGLDFPNSNHIIRWTEVFIIKSDDESAHGKDPVDMSKVSEQIARSASIALVSFLDLLAANGLYKLGIRATIDNDQVCYEAGSNYDKLGPLYMNALDNELIPTLHRQATNLQLDQPITIELIFHILDI